MVKMVILWSNFVVKSRFYHFDHRTFVYMSAMVMVKMGIFVVNSRGDILGWPFWQWKIWILDVVMVEILTIWPWLFWNFGHDHGQKFLTTWPRHPGVGQMFKKSWSPYSPTSTLNCIHKLVFYVITDYSNKWTRKRKLVHFMYESHSQAPNSFHCNWSADDTPVHHE